MKRILITGANSGIGFETAKALLKRKYAVILGCRTVAKGETAKSRLTQQFGLPAADISTLAIDLASFEAIRQAANATPVDVWGIICNAAVSYAGSARFTTDGIEETFGVNHLGHFLLVNLLLDKLEVLRRITIVSSAGHDPNAGTPFPPPDVSNLSEIAHPADPSRYENGNLRYANSKLCNLLFTYELTRRLAAAGKADVVINAFNPGLVPGTGLAKRGPAHVRLLWYYVLPLFKKIVPRIRSVSEAGQELGDVATTMDIHGKYVDKTMVVPSSAASYDEAKAKELWAFSEQLTGEHLHSTVG